MRLTRRQALQGLLLSALSALAWGLFRRTGAATVVETVSGNVTWSTGKVIAAGDTLRFDPNVSTTVTVSGGSVHVMGTLEMRPANQRVTHRLKFTNINEASYAGSGADPHAINLVDRGLWVTGAGKLDVSGSAKLPWVRLTAAANAGTKAITLPQAPTGWQVGDVLSIAPTGKDSIAHDERTITGIAGNTVTLNSNLTTSHPVVNVGHGLRYGAEVLNLTRNVVIGGETGKKAHTLIMSTAHQVIDFARFEFLGPQKGTPKKKILGRWMFHLHHGHDAQRGDVYEGLVAIDGGSHAFVAHQTNGITYKQCIAHRTAYDQFWWDAEEDTTGVERSDDVLHDRCVASAMSDGDGTINRRFGFAALRGDGNIMRDCVAVGGTSWGSDTAGIGWKGSGNGEWIWQGRNISHNNNRSGTFTWENLRGGGRFVDGFVLYHNKGPGIWHGAYNNNYHYTDCISYGNGVDGALALHARSNAQDPAEAQWKQTYRSCLFDAGGKEYAVRVEDTRIGSQGKPVRFIGCEFKGGTVAQIGNVAHTQTGEGSSMLDFECCTFTGPDLVMGAAFNTALHPTEWRRQDAATGTGFALTPNQESGAVRDVARQAYRRSIPDFTNCT